jgi:hypothetical protein
MNAAVNHIFPYISKLQFWALHFRSGQRLTSASMRHSATVFSGFGLTVLDLQADVSIGR